jgi:hypothetical protein
VAYGFQWNVSAHKRLGNSEGDLSSLWAHLSTIRSGKVPEQPFTDPFYLRASELCFVPMSAPKKVAYRKRLIKTGKVTRIQDDDLVMNLREFHKLRNDTSYCADHGILQDFLLTDPQSIAIEVPVWSPRFRMSGHIDLVRYKDDRIQVCDYKPGKLEDTPKRFLGSIPQVAAYGEMMTHHLASTLQSALEGRLLPSVECCIFDTHSCWTFGAEIFVELFHSKKLEGL